MRVLYVASSKVVRFAQRKEPDKVIQVVCQSVEKYGSDLYLFFTVNGIKRDMYCAGFIGWIYLPSLPPPPSLHSLSTLEQYTVLR
jgi:hypothetical protein